MLLSLTGKSKTVVGGNLAPLSNKCDLSTPEKTTINKFLKRADLGRALVKGYNHVSFFRTDSLRYRNVFKNT